MTIPQKKLWKLYIIGFSLLTLPVSTLFITLYSLPLHSSIWLALANWILAHMTQRLKIGTWVGAHTFLSLQENCQSWTFKTKFLGKFFSVKGQIINILGFTDHKILWQLPHTTFLVKKQLYTVCKHMGRSVSQ